MFKLKYYRELKGLSVDELAGLSGVKRSVIAAIEAESAKVIHAGDMVKIAEALEVRVSDIFFT